MTYKSEGAAGEPKHRLSGQTDRRKSLEKIEKNAGLTMITSKQFTVLNAVMPKLIEDSGEEQVFVERYKVIY